MSSPDQRYFTDLAATVANALREDIGNGDLTPDWYRSPQQPVRVSSAAKTP